MRDALIVYGGWAGHEPEDCARVVQGLLEEDGFRVRLDTSTQAFADPALCDLSLVVPIMTMSKIEKEQALGLAAAVEGGVGLAGFHGGAGDAFRESVEYQFVLGGQWVAHLSPTRNAKAAKRCPAWALRGLKASERPVIINTDKAPTYGAAIATLKEGKLGPDVQRRQVQHLNKRLESDHDKLKQLIRLRSASSP